jgi:hypothetical protein
MTIIGIMDAKRLDLCHTGRCRNKSMLKNDAVLLTGFSTFSARSNEV